MKYLPLEYYKNNDVVSIARSLLGKSLISKIDGCKTGGIITETEAYNGKIDKASHAFGGRRTQRTEVMYKEGGISYVYLCYGIHYMLNVVTSRKEDPHAVLIRAIYPIIGMSKMLERTGKKKANYQMTNGPGKLTKALGINLNHNALSYCSDTLWIEESEMDISDKDISVSTRIGIEYAEEDALLPYRFLLDYSRYI